MTPAEQVGLILAEAKRQGWLFGAAWMKALQSLPRDGDLESKLDMDDWRLQLEWAKPAFQASYEGRCYYVVHRNTNVSQLGVVRPMDFLPSDAVVRDAVRSAA